MHTDPGQFAELVVASLPAPISTHCPKLRNRADSGSILLKEGDWTLIFHSMQAPNHLQRSSSYWASSPCSRAPEDSGYYKPREMEPRRGKILHVRSQAPTGYG